MTKIRMGIIGTGMAFARLHLPAYQELRDKFKIAAICDADDSKADYWGEILNLKSRDIYYDFQEMITRDDLDAFDIMVPIEINFETTEAVAGAGKPIICEKPLAATKEQAEAVRELPEKYNIPIMIAENYRYNEEINIIRDLVRNKEIGEINYFIKNKVIDFPRDMLKDKFAAREWRQYPDFQGGAFMDTGIHDLAGLRHIFGAVEYVQGFAQNNIKDFSPYSVIQSNILFTSGVIGNYSFFCTGKEMQRPLIGLRIFGDKGMIYLEESACGIINVTYNNGSSRRIPYQPDRGFYNELLNFYQTAAGKEVLSVTPDMEFGDLMTILAILKSIDDKIIVRVNEKVIYSYEKPVIH